MSTKHGNQHRRLGAFAAAVGLTATAFVVGVGGSGGLPIAQAAVSGSVASSVVTITPVRAADTRSGTGLSGTVVANTNVKLDLTGAIPTRVGSADVTQTVVPDGATGVLLNVTAVRPSAGGFVSIRPGDSTGEPSSSNLNVQVGVAVPNAVTVALPTSGAAAGTIDIWYGSGATDAQTNLLVDIVGYTVEATAGTGVPGPAGTDGMDGADGMDASTPDNVVWVAPSGGDYMLLSDAVAASSANTLIRIAPGTYTETTPVVLPSNVVVQGSGRTATTITCACGGASEADDGDTNSATLAADSVSGTEVRDLTVVNTGGGGDVAIAMKLIASSGLIIDNVGADASGASTNVGFANHDRSSPSIDGLVATATGGTQATGLSVSSDSRPRMSRSTATASDATSNSSLFITDGSAPTMDNMEFTASGGTNRVGVEADGSSRFVLADTFIDIPSGGGVTVALAGLGTGFIADSTIIGAVAAINLTCINARDGVFAPLDGACDTI